jgi:hypothetical protein
MQDKLNFDDILGRYRADPYDYHDVFAPHTGRIRFNVKTEDEVEGVTGEWHHIPGTLLYNLERERNIKPVHSITNGIVATINSDAEGQFVEAGERILTIKHPMTKREIIDKILVRVLYMFNAPERAKYFFSLDIQSKIDKFGQRSVSVKSGDEILTMSLMKRDTPVCYEGEPGIIHSVYFSPGDSIDQGTPILGICPEEKLSLIEKIITRVKAEWE